MAIRSLYPQKRKTDKYDEDEKSKYEDEEDSDNEGSYDECDEDDSDDDSYEDSDEDEDTLNSEILEDAVFCKAKPCKFNSASLRAGIRVINCKSGKRLEISKKILSTLGNPNEISFLYTNKLLILATSDEPGFLLKGRKHNIVYSSALVAEIAKRFSLDFSDCTCITCPDIKVFDGDVNAIAVVMK